MLEPTPAKPTLSRLIGLYSRIGFGLLVLFGVVGNFLGKTETSVIIFVITVIVWTCVRISLEAIEAWLELRASKRDNGPPPPPSIA